MPFLKSKLPVTRERVDAKQIERWVRELDADKFATRETAPSTPSVAHGANGD